MNVRCPHCGTGYDVEKKEMYRYMKCGACGKGFVAGATTSLQKESHQKESPSVALPPIVQPHDVPSPNEEPRQRPKLALRRPTAANNGETSGGAAVAAVEARYKEQRRRELMARIRRIAGSTFSVLLLLALLLGGYKAWRAFKNKGGGDFTDAINRTIGRGGNFLGNDTKPPEVESKPAPGVPEGGHESKVETQKPGQDMFNVLVNEFKDSNLSFWRELDKSKRPGAVDGRFVALIPRGRKSFCCYEILSSQGGITNITSFVEKSDGVQVSQPDFENILNANGGFVFVDGVSYAFRPKTSRKDFQAPRSGDKFDPGREYLGMLFDIASECGITTDGVSYKISFVFSDGDDPIEVETVNHGKCVSYDAFKIVAKSMAKEVQRKSMRKPALKKFTPTVIFYDGHLIANGIRLTKVPRHFPGNFSTSYNKWVRLRDEALRQESEAQRIDFENKRKIDEWKRQMDGPPDPDIVQKVLFSGKVLITAKSRD